MDRSELPRAAQLTRYCVSGMDFCARCFAVCEPIREDADLTIVHIIKISDRLPVLFGHRRAEIGVLVRDPIDELANARVGQQALHIHPITLQFGIGEIGDQLLLANRGCMGTVSRPPRLLGAGCWAMTVFPVGRPQSQRVTVSVGATRTGNRPSTRDQPSDGEKPCPQHFRHAGRNAAQPHRRATA